MSQGYVELRVETAKQRDVGKKIARIPRRYMDILGLKYGDFVEVEGNKGSVILQVWPAYREDENRDIIRIDGYTREAIGAGVGEYVRVRKAIVERGTKVVLAPIGRSMFRFDRTFADYIKDQLLYKPVRRGEVIAIPLPLSLFGGEALRFVVVSTQPTHAVYVDDTTEVIVKSEPIREEVLARGVPRVTWEDIGDLEEVKARIREIVELPMRHPELFRHLGIEPPKGILLIGPPGCGKTLLAKAVANEVNAYFIAINGPEIVSKYYGESEARLREIFEEAKKNAPAIIFIDEIDAIAPKRDEVTGEVEKRVVAQLLTLMDGLQERGQVIVIGATNRPEALDPALRRPGRFDREIYIGMPDKRARKEILAVHTRNVPLCTPEDVEKGICKPDDVVDLEKIAEMTHGYTGADLAALVKEAAMIRLRKAIESKEIDIEQPEIPPDQLQKIKVSMRDFLEALKYVQPTVLREVIVEVPEVHWDDIGGYENIKQELREIVEWPLKYPKYFEELGVEPPKGILLFGPPGTGKTLLAKAVATESGANFIAVRGPEILSKWFGESERAIREIFKKARMAAPCVIFFDEIDAIAPARGFTEGESHAMERIVAQLLAEMDGIAPLENVVVIAATNRPDLLDPALLRPGRLDRIIYVPPPDIKARFEILKIHTRNVPLAKDVDLEELARMTEGYTGADLELLVREAVLLAMREDINCSEVQMRHFLEALKKIKPSITPEMLRFYESWYEKIKQVFGKERVRTVPLHV